jgi:ATP-binding cassette subfamily F protein uup
LLSILFATDPKVILADEITNHLDLETVQIVTNWIQNSRASMLLVDHNQDFLNTISRHFLFLPNNQKRQIINLPGMSFDEVLVYLDDLQARQKIEQDQFLRRKKQLEKQIEMLRFRAEVFNADVGSAMKAAQTKFQKEIVENQIAYEQDLRKNVVFKSQANQAKIKKIC